MHCERLVSRNTVPPLSDTLVTKALIVTVAHEGLVEQVAHKV